MPGALSIPSHFQNWNAPPESVGNTKHSPYSPSPPIYKRRWFILLAVVSLLAVVIAIVVPLAMLLPKKKGKQHYTVLVPLYIYPNTTTTWAPVYDAASSHPDLKFLVIVNPSSGPGSKDHPDEQYQAALMKLSTYSNVEMVGYVRTVYATRKLADVLSDVSTYAGWSSVNSSFAMHGIFLDEAPHQRDEAATTYMRDVSKAVKDAKGLQHPRTVIRNPGVIPDAGFDDSNTDIIVTFEQSYEEYPGLQRDLAAFTGGRSRSAHIVHSVPPMSRDKLQDLVGGVRNMAEYVFVTTNDKDYYESFGSDWADFVDVLAA